MRSSINRFSASILALSAVAILSRKAHNSFIDNDLKSLRFMMAPNHDLNANAP